MSTDTQRAASKALYERRRANGQCVRCGEPAARDRNGKVMAKCEPHLNEDAAQKREERHDPSQ